MEETEPLQAPFNLNAHLEDMLERRAMISLSQRRDIWLDDKIFGKHFKPLCGQLTASAAAKNQFIVLTDLLHPVMAGEDTGLRPNNSRLVAVFSQNPADVKFYFGNSGIEAEYLIDMNFNSRNAILYRKPEDLKKFLETAAGLNKTPRGYSKTIPLWVKDIAQSLLQDFYFIQEFDEKMKEKEKAAKLNPPAASPRL